MVDKVTQADEELKKAAKSEAESQARKRRAQERIDKVKRKTVKAGKAAGEKAAAAGKTAAQKTAAAGRAAGKTIGATARTAGGVVNTGLRAVTGVPLAPVSAVGAADFVGAEEQRQTDELRSLAAQDFGAAAPSASGVEIQQADQDAPFFSGESARRASRVVRDFTNPERFDFGLGDGRRPVPSLRIRDSRAETGNNLSRIGTENFGFDIDPDGLPSQFLSSFVRDPAATISSSDDLFSQDQAATNDTLASLRAQTETPGEAAAAFEDLRTIQQRLSNPEILGHLANPNLTPEDRSRIINFATGGLRSSGQGAVALLNTLEESGARPEVLQAIRASTGDSSLTEQTPTGLRELQDREIAPGVPGVSQESRTLGASGQIFSGTGDQGEPLFSDRQLPGTRRFADIDGQGNLRNLDPARPQFNTEGDRQARENLLSRTPPGQTFNADEFGIDSLRSPDLVRTIQRDTAALVAGNASAAGLADLSPRDRINSIQQRIEQGQAAKQEYLRSRRFRQDVDQLGGVTPDLIRRAQTDTVAARRLREARQEGRKAALEVAEDRFTPKFTQALENFGLETNDRANAQTSAAVSSAAQADFNDAIEDTTTNEAAQRAIRSMARRTGLTDAVRTGRVPGTVQQEEIMSLYVMDKLVQGLASAEGGGAFVDGIREAVQQGGVVSAQDLLRQQFSANGAASQNFQIIEPEILEAIIDGDVRGAFADRVLNTATLGILGSKGPETVILRGRNGDITLGDLDILNDPVLLEFLNQEINDANR